MASRGRSKERPDPESPDRDGMKHDEAAPTTADRAAKRPRRPGLVIGPTTGDADVQLEWHAEP